MNKQLMRGIVNALMLLLLLLLLSFIYWKVATVGL
jgi:hypothetical protein